MVGQAVVFFRQRPQGFGQQANVIHAHAELAGFGVEQRPLGGDDVADVVLFEFIVVRAGGQRIPLHEQLDAPAHVVDMGERGLAHETPGHQPPGDLDPHRFRRQLFFVRSRRKLLKQIPARASRRKSLGKALPAARSAASF